MTIASRGHGFGWTAALPGASASVNGRGIADEADFDLVSPA